MGKTGTDVVITEDGAIADPLPGDHLWDNESAMTTQPADSIEWLLKHRFVVLVGLHVIGFGCWSMLLVLAIIIG